MANTDLFELDYKNERIRVERRLFANQVIYRVLFSNKSAPLALTRTTADNVKKFWTSVPEGRQLEAEEIGLLIEAFIKANQ
jgi:hypothetical protein